jgi:hypothetical protein
MPIEGKEWTGLIWFKIGKGDGLFKHDNKHFNPKKNPGISCLVEELLDCYYRHFSMEIISCVKSSYILEKTPVFWNMTPCRPTHRHRRFGDVCCFQLK